MNNKHVTDLDRLNDQTKIAILHVLIKLRGNYDNNLTNKELDQYMYLIDWYNNTYEDSKIVYYS